MLELSEAGWEVSSGETGVLELGAAVSVVTVLEVGATGVKVLVTMLVVAVVVDLTVTVLWEGLPTVRVITVEQLLDSVVAGNTSALWVVVLEVVIVVDGTTTGLASV